MIIIFSNKFTLSEFIIKLQLHFLNDIFIKLIVSDIWPKIEWHSLRSSVNIAIWFHHKNLYFMSNNSRGLQLGSFSLIKMWISEVVQTGSIWWVDIKYSALKASCRCAEPSSTNSSISLCLNCPTTLLRFSTVKYLSHFITDQMNDGDDDDTYRQRCKFYVQENSASLQFQLKRL